MNIVKKLVESGICVSMAQARQLAATLKSEKLDELLRKGCPLTGQSCCEKKKTCEPDWGGHGEPAFCHLK